MVFYLYAKKYKKRLNGSKDIVICYFSAKNDQKSLKFAKRQFSLKKSLGSTYTPSLMVSNFKKKVDFVQLPHPLLLLFALFLGKKAFLQKNDNIILKILWYSIYMQKNIKNG